MGTFDKVRNYYAQFDEWGRLDSPSGILERAEVIKIVLAHVPKEAKILDVGSGPGRYAIEFAKRGYQLSLIDLSPKLIDIAIDKFEEAGLSGAVESFLVGNATDLS